jgi:hypothetical protein
MAWGRGGGGRWYAPPVYGPGVPYSQSPEHERSFIEDSIRGLKSQLEAMEKRLSELSKSEAEK